MFFSGGGSVLSFLALLCFLDTEKLLDLLYKGLHQLWEVFQCLQKRLAFFFEPVIAFLQSLHSRGRIEILPLIVGNVAFQILDFAAACDTLLCKCRELLVIALRNGNLAGDGFLSHSLLRYFGIRGIASTSLSLPNCRFAPETQKRPKPDPAVWFRGDFGRFLSI